MLRHYLFVCALSLLSVTVDAQSCTLTQADLQAAPSGAYTIPAGQVLCISSNFCMGAASNFPGACANSNISSITVNGILRIAPNVTFNFAGSVNGSGAIEIMEGGMVRLFGSINCTGMSVEVVDAGISSGTSTNALPSCSNTSCEVVYPGDYRPFGIVTNGLGYTTTGCSLTGYPNNGILLPVSFTGFSGYAAGTGIRLLWSTASEQRNKGFAVERINAAGAWEPAGWVPSKATEGNNIRILVQSASPEHVQISVVNASGALLYKGSHALNAGSNLILIPAAVYPKGLQVVTLQRSSGEIKRGKIVLR